MLINSHKTIQDLYYDYWNYKGHDYAGCHYHEKIKNIYINIPKNASTNIRTAIMNSNFTGMNTLQSKIFPEYDSAVVVLRDPIQRWISGITTYLNNYVIGLNQVGDFLKNLENNKCFMELLFERVSFDDHSEKQVYFLKPFDLSNSYFFYLDELFELRFSQFYAGEGVKIDFNHSNKNYNSRDPVHQFFTEFLADYKNQTYKEKLKKHFEEDYELINSVTFYGR
jgi:hypothetical protein